ncbi:MAG: hypothetical protein QM479_13145 [Pseudomonadota bacterium]
MQLTLNIKNEALAQKILWLLEHFKKDGLEVIENKSNIEKTVYSDEYVKENWRELAYNASGDPEQDDDDVLREKYGKYLNEKHSI